MDNRTIFFTQLGSILVYLGTLFYVYRVLIQQKDATIEFLNTKLREAEKHNPDLLFERLKKREALLQEELAQLVGENSNLISKKEEQLADLQRLQELAGDMFCPVCKAILIEDKLETEWLEHDGKDHDIDHSIKTFACGCQTVDDDVSVPCPQTPIKIPLPRGIS